MTDRLRARRVAKRLLSSEGSAEKRGIRGGQPVTDAVVEYRKATPCSPESALFVTHSPDGRLKSHVRPYIAALRRQKIHVTLIVAADKPWFDRETLHLDEVDALVVRENRGLDFAAWAHVLQLQPELFDAEILYLLNDSMIGPFNDVLFGLLMSRLRSAKADVIGLTENWEHHWHIQSYFIALRRRALASPVLQSFFNEVVAAPSKDEVILRFEITLAPVLRGAGMSCTVLYPSKNRSNRTVLDWRGLIEEGFPFVKVMVLRDEIPGVDRNNWRQLLGGQGYDVASAEPVAQAVAPSGRQVIADSTVSQVPARSTLPRHLSGATLEPTIQFVGPWNYDNGLGVAGRSYISALRHTPYALNLAPIRRPFHVHHRTAVSMDINDFSGPPDVAAVHLNPEAWPALLVDEQKRVIESARLKLGLWVWETDRIPDGWHSAFDSVDAIWAPSRYCQDIFAANTSAPVHLVPYVVTVPPTLPPAHDIFQTKQEIGLNGDDRVIFYAFDGSSFLARKNPFALVRAFAQTRLGRSGWKLVLKTKHLFDLPKQGVQLQQLCDGAEGVVLIDRGLDQAAMHNLMAMTDVYASPHCAEGFGLTVAEAMAMGKIVVATDYSGTRDFLDGSCGFPVRFSVGCLTEDIGAYPKGCRWAQIDEGHLAECLERAATLIERGDHSIGAQARARIARNLCANRIGALMRQSIQQLLAPWRQA